MTFNKNHHNSFLALLANGAGGGGGGGGSGLVAGGQAAQAAKHRADCVRSLEGIVEELKDGIKNNTGGLLDEDDEVRKAMGKGIGVYVKNLKAAVMNPSDNKHDESLTVVMVLKEQPKSTIKTAEMIQRIFDKEGELVVKVFGAENDSQSSGYDW